MEVDKVDNYEGLRRVMNVGVAIKLPKHRALLSC